MEAGLQLSQAVVEKLVDAALAEDLGWGDVTTDSLIPDGLMGRASITAKAGGVLAGIEVVRAVFYKVDHSLKFDGLVSDGARVVPGDVVAIIEGRASGILKAERTALNFLQHLSGVASETSCYVEAVAGLSVQILDTRKTVPGLRVLDKYAVAVGGGKNHRQHLGDGVLIKDNHLVALRSAGLGLKEALMKIRHNVHGQIEVEVEAETVEEAVEAVEAGADTVMLDNMNLDEMQRVVEMVAGRARLEASGGVTLDNVRSVAETGVDFISIGALTHSSKALDFSLSLKPL
jgi:nicotinate-nucleotide pyrophosphorylase (carboxylating)